MRHKYFNRFLMSGIIFSLIGMSFFSCNKILNRVCWDCEVQRMNGTKYNEKVCRDDENYPQFYDDNGNDLNAVCTKR